MFRTYDSWKASGLHDDMPSVEDLTDRCACGAPMTPASPTRCSDDCQTMEDRDE